MLRATTMLADNTIAMLEGWVAAFGRAGLDVRFDAMQPAAPRAEMVHAGDVDVLFACGLLTADLVGSGTPYEVVAAPVFPGETAPVYRSVVIARADAGVTSITDAAGLRLGVNEYGSWSGWHGYKAHLRGLGLWPADGRPDHVCTGGHVQSIEAVLAGTADVAAIDHTVWRHWVAGVGAAADDLRVIDTTEDWPAPPVSVAIGLGAAERRAVVEVLAAAGLVPTTVAAYEFMLAEQARP